MPSRPHPHDVLVARGNEPDNVPGLAAESLIIKIGENVARLSLKTAQEHSDIPWPLIKRMRDRLAHLYEGTNYGAVWDTLVFDLPTIRDYIEPIVGM